MQRKHRRDAILKSMNRGTAAASIRFPKARRSAIRFHLSFYQDDRMTIDGVHNRINLRGYDSRHAGIHYAGTSRSRKLEQRLDHIK